MTPKSDHRVALSIFGFCAVIYGLLAGGHTYSSDEEGLFITTEALVERQSPTVVVSDKNDGVLPIRTGRTGAPVTVGGFGQSVVATPLYVAGSVAGKGIKGGNFGDYPERLFVGWTNSIVTAVGVAVLFLLGRRLGASQRWATILALVYGLGTYAMPHAKTFFSEPLAATLSLVAVYFIVRSGQDRSIAAAAAAGTSIGFALHARASAGIYLPMLGLYLLFTWSRPRFVLRKVIVASSAFAVGLVVPASLLLASNWWRFGDPLDVGYESIPLTYPIGEGLYGLFLSPGKSIFLYAPVVLLGLAAPFAVPRPLRPAAVLCFGMAMANALFFARFPFWHGDHSWGPRYLLLSLPFFIAPIASLLERPAWRKALIGTGAVGCLIALLGSVMYFNQYFHIAERASVPKLEILDDGPNYWRQMHYKPYWSPVAGHARALPAVLTNSARRLDGRDTELQEYPGTTNEKYGWYFAPPQMDSWVYWLFPTGGPKRFLLLVPFLLLALAMSARSLLPILRR